MNTRTLTVEEVAKIHAYTEVINNLHYEIEQIIFDTPWKEIARIPTLKLKAVVQHRRQEGCTISESRIAVEAYIASLPRSINLES